MTTHLIFYSTAILIGIVLYFFIRNKIIDKKILQTIILTWVFSTFYFSMCFSFINTYGIDVFSLSVSRYLHYVQIVPLIIIITFSSLYWLRHFRGKEEKNTEKQISKDSEIIFITFVTSTALINLFLPPINELWLKLVIMLGFGAIVGFIVGLFLWKNRKRKKSNE